MNEPIVTITGHFTYKNKIIVILSNGNLGVSKCHPIDDYDMDFGTQLAVARAYKNKELEEYLINNKYHKPTNVNISLNDIYNNEIPTYTNSTKNINFSFVPDTNASNTLKDQLNIKQNKFETHIIPQEKYEAGDLVKIKNEKEIIDLCKKENINSI